MYAGTHFTDPGRMESWVNFSGKEGHPNIQPSTRPGIEPGTSGLGGRDLNHCANPSAITYDNGSYNKDNSEDAMLSYICVSTFVSGLGMVSNRILLPQIIQK